MGMGEGTECPAGLQAVPGSRGPAILTVRHNRVMQEGSSKRPAGLQAALGGQVGGFTVCRLREERWG